jgi:hypothetical protein
MEVATALARKLRLEFRIVTRDEVARTCESPSLDLTIPSAHNVPASLP